MAAAEVSKLSAVAFGHQLHRSDADDHDECQHDSVLDGRWARFIAQEIS